MGIWLSDTCLHTVDMSGTFAIHPGPQLPIHERERLEMDQNLCFLGMDPAKFGHVPSENENGRWQPSLIAYVRTVATLRFVRTIYPPRSFEAKRNSEGFLQAGYSECIGVWMAYIRDLLSYNEFQKV